VRLVYQALPNRMDAVGPVCSYSQFLPPQATKEGAWKDYTKGELLGK
jgi:hypothetical protein